MQLEKSIATIEQARGLLRTVLADCDIPQIESMLRNADMELHWALWNLGMPVALRPDFE